MRLSEEDSKLFYSLWLSLLDYTNAKFKVNPKLKNMATATRLNPTDVKEVADKLWDNVEIIDTYLEKNTSLPEEHKEIVRSWKNRIQGMFILERHLKKGSILLSADENVYLVSGIVSSWEEMLYGVRLPIMMDVTLIPFRDVIISDGLVNVYPVAVGPNMKKNFKETYMTAKKNGQIISSHL